MLWPIHQANGARNFEVAEVTGSEFEALYAAVGNDAEAEAGADHGFDDFDVGEF